MLLATSAVDTLQSPSPAPSSSSDNIAGILLEPKAEANTENPKRFMHVVFIIKCFRRATIRIILTDIVVVAIVLIVVVVLAQILTLNPRNIHGI